MRKLLNKGFTLISRACKGSSNAFKGGFTLIELLVVIAIVGILMAVVIIGINPIDKINQANDSKVMSDVGTVGSALEAYATLNTGSYPDNTDKVSGLVASGDLKLAPVAATGYTYTYTALPVACTTAGKTCTSACYSGTLKAAKYTATPFWKYATSATTGGTALATATGC